jgi:hypothetical protein
MILINSSSFLFVLTFASLPLYSGILTQVQDTYLNINIQDIEKIEITNQASRFQLPQDSGEPLEQIFSTYSYCTNRPNYRLKASLTQPLPDDVQLFLKAEAPVGAETKNWVEIDLIPKVLVDKIPSGSAKNLKIDIKFKQKGVADAFDLKLLQIQYVFDAL